MALSKLDLALVAIATAGLIWIEHNHRIVIGPMAAAEAPAPAASLCPETDNAPMSTACIKFIGGSVSWAVRPGPPAQSPHSRPVTRSGSTVLAAPDGY
jgi:hypothetical protein